MILRKTTHCSDFHPGSRIGKRLVGFNPSGVRQRSQDELVTLKDGPQLRVHHSKAEEVMGGGEFLRQ